MHYEQCLCLLPAPSSFTSHKLFGKILWIFIIFLTLHSLAVSWAAAFIYCCCAHGDSDSDVANFYPSIILPLCKGVLDESIHLLNEKEKFSATPPSKSDHFHFFCKSQKPQEIVPRLLENLSTNPAYSSPFFSPPLSVPMWWVLPHALSFKASGKQCLTV